jgi:hypothetical protein
MDKHPTGQALKDIQARKFAHDTLAKRERVSMVARQAEHSKNAVGFLEATGDGTNAISLPHVRTQHGKHPVPLLFLCFHVAFCV